MMPDDLRPTTREDLLTAISYGLRFRRGKAHRRYNELTAQLAAEALADILDDLGLVVMRKAPGRSAAGECSGLVMRGDGRPGDADDAEPEEDDDEAEAEPLPAWEAAPERDGFVWVWRKTAQTGRDILSLDLAATIRLIAVDKVD